MGILLEKIRDFRSNNAKEREYTNQLIGSLMFFHNSLRLLEKSQMLTENSLTKAWQHREYKSNDLEMIMLSNCDDEYNRGQLKIPSKKVRKLVNEIAKIICEENQEKTEVYDKIPATIKKMRMKSNERKEVNE